MLAYGVRAEKTVHSGEEALDSRSDERLARPQMTYESTRTGPSDPLLTELAALLAHGYLRLTRKAETASLSEAEQPQKPLDFSEEQSVHGVQESQHRRPRWT